MADDIFDLPKVANDFCDLLEETELAKGAGAMRAAGFSEPFIRAAEVLISIADDPKEAEQAIGAYVENEQRQAELQQWLHDLPDMCRRIDVENVSAQTGLPPREAEARLREYEGQIGLEARLRGWK